MKKTIKLLLLNSKIFMWGYNKYINRNRKIFRSCKKLFKNKSGVEIGGPSFVFTKDGPVPLYKIINQLDNINYSDKTFWGKIDEGENFKFNINKQNGKQIIADATDLSKINDDFYEFMLSSHVIEHVANPIRALNEWQRIIKTGGYLAIIAPNALYTYDRNRPITKIEHIIGDFNNLTEESDNTHFDEVINMHDLTNDSTVNSYEDHVKRTLNNLNTRIVHHHTFNMDLLIDLLKYCNFKIISTQSFKPYHLMVVAQKV